MKFRSLSMQAAAFFVAVSFATTVSAAAWNLLDSLSINGSISVGPDLPEEDVVSELTRVEIAGVFEAALGSAGVVTPEFLKLNLSVAVFPTDEQIAIVGEVSEVMGPVPPEFFEVVGGELPLILADAQAFLESENNPGFFTIPEDADELFGGLQIDYSFSLDGEQTTLDLLEQPISVSFAVCAAFTEDQLSVVEDIRIELMSLLEIIDLGPALSQSSALLLDTSEIASFYVDLSVAAVPVPAALPLALFGVATLGFIGRRRRRST